MSNIVQFTRKAPQQPFPTLTPDDVDALRLYDFRGEWERTSALVKSPADMREILDHCILLQEIADGICVASLIKHDKVAAQQLCSLLQTCLADGLEWVNLSDISRSNSALIGYVWTYDFQVIVNARVVVGYLFPEGDEDLGRTIYFPNNA